MMIKSLQKYFVKISRNSSRSAVTYVESMYNAWRRDPKSVHRSWDAYFRNSPSFDLEEVEQMEKRSAAKGKECRYESTITSMDKMIDDYLNLQTLIRNYQTIGYSIARSSPFELEDQDPHEDLIADLQFSTQDWERRYRLPSTTLIGGKERNMELKEIIKRLRDIYCREIGVEYMFLESPEECAWIQHQIEDPYARKFSPEHQRQMLIGLAKAVGFDEFLAQQFQVEQNIRLTGCEMLVPALNKIIELCSAKGVKSFVLGLPRRGRLNILANVCKKPLKDIFSLFNGNKDSEGDDLDDFKYSLGTFVEGTNEVTKKNVRFTVVSGPTNFQATVPIVLGRTSAEQFLSQDYIGEEIMAILVHDSTDFYAPGIAYEAMHLSTLPHYKTNGAIHVITNTQAINQSVHASQYCRNISRMLNAPVFHVNADDPDAVIHVCKIASEWRAQFHRDVIIELDVYPRPQNSNNENGIFSTPTESKNVSRWTQYISKLLKKFSVIIPDAEAAIDKYKTLCQNALDATARWKPFDRSLWHEMKCTKLQTIETGVDENTLMQIGNSFLSPPKYEPHFVMCKTIHPIVLERKMMLENQLVDWNLAESLAIGSLLREKIPVRLAMQNAEKCDDVSMQRHHLIHHRQKKGKTYNLLQNIYPKQSPYVIFNNSHNNEAASLAFEFGYSIANPNMLVLWEAPASFDYTSTAQTIIDQFIATGESKWEQQSSLVMLIQYGSESSSIRLERYLQMCSDSPTDVPYDDGDNMENQLRNINWIVANCTSPANCFHILRRQLSLPFRKPLVLMVSENLRNLGEVTCSLNKLNQQNVFQALIPENISDENCCTDNFKRLIFCSGRIFFDLVKIRAEKKLENEIAIARIEQLAPFPYVLAGVEVKFFEHADLVWVQEEPKNQGAWSYVLPRLQTVADNRDINCIGRPCSELSVPVSKAQHRNELKALLDEAMSVDCTYW